MRLIRDSGGGPKSLNHDFMRRGDRQADTKIFSPAEAHRQR